MTNPVIIALDVESAAEARRLVSSLGDAAPFYKVGLELYAASGMEYVRELLTSFDERDLADLGYPGTVEDLVELRARKAVEAGMDGIVCSPLEVARIRALAGPALKLVTPGVRSAGAAAGDQKRVAPPRRALDDGADYLVVGRQVTRAADPRAELDRILSEITG